MVADASTVGVASSPSTFDSLATGGDGSMGLRPNEKVSSCEGTSRERSAVIERNYQYPVERLRGMITYGHWSGLACSCPCPSQQEASRLECAPKTSVSV